MSRTVAPRTIGWGMTVALVGSAGGAAVALPPQAAPLLIAGVAVAIAVARLHTRPAWLLAFALTAILLSRGLMNLTGNPALGYMDEAAVAGMALLGLRRLPLGFRRFPGGRWFLLFIACGVVGAALNDVPPVIALPGLLLAAKGGVLAWAVAQLDWDEAELRSIARYGVAVGAAAMLVGAVNLAYPQRWTALIATGGGTRQRWGLTPLVGPFAHPTEWGGIMALLAVAAAAWVVTMSRSGRTVLLGGLVAACMSLRRKTLLGLALVIPFVLSRVRGASATLWTALLVGVGLVAGWDLLRVAGRELTTEYLSNPDEVARVVLLRGAMDVANGAPFGAGFGRYGSHVAAETYSPEYVARGFEAVRGLERGGVFLTDSQWPAILGETGWPGVAAFALMLFAAYRAGRRLFQDGAGATRWAGLVMMGWTLQMLVESSGNPVFYSPPIFGPYFAMVGIVAVLTVPDQTRSDTVVDRPARVRGFSAPDEQ